MQLMVVVTTRIECCVEDEGVLNGGLRGID